MNPVSQIRHVTNPATGEEYDALVFWCPGCERIDADGERQAGAHMLPVNCTVSDRASWTWDGNLEAPTLSPSILSRNNYYTGPDTPPREFVCHSFLKNGMFEFLGDCTHALAGQTVPIPPLPDWLVKE